MVGIFSWFIPYTNPRVNWLLKPVLFSPEKSGLGSRAQVARRIESTKSKGKRCCGRNFNGDSRDPQEWDPLMVSFPYYSHIFRDSLGIHTLNPWYPLDFFEDSDCWNITSYLIGNTSTQSGKKIYLIETKIDLPKGSMRLVNIIYIHSIPTNLLWKIKHSCRTVGFPKTKTGVSKERRFQWFFPTKFVWTTNQPILEVSSSWICFKCLGKKTNNIFPKWWFGAGKTMVKSNKNITQHFPLTVFSDRSAGGLVKIHQQAYRIIYHFLR